ncbi:MFS transporter [Streptomyces sp. NBC_00306]|uniref:MFS transporter n=1 Tax=Streptomyces sp. NBC_00306 TaxID=2975708 RepID=UPI002E29F358|nr:MFS transporter [Streptomyces sp. NBC_00306]
MPLRIVPPSGSPRTLALAQLVNSLGDGAYYVCSALYFARVVGLSPARIGLGLTVAWGIGSLAGVALGQLADRRGPRPTAVVLALATSASVASFLFVRSFTLFLLAACCYATAQCGLAAARQALLASLVAKEERTGTLAYLQSTLNAGLAVGAALGGFALHFGSREAHLSVFVLDAAAFALCALVLLRLPDVRVDHPPHRTAARQAVFRDLPYAVVTFLNMIMLLRMPLISLAIPLWIVERTSAPGWAVSALLVLNTGAVMLFQVRTAAAVRDLPSATRTVRRGGVAMLASCAVFALSAAAGVPARVAVAVLLAGAALQVWGEMMQSAGAWQISFDLAPAGRHGQYQGFFGAGVPVARMLGPVLLTTLVVGLGVIGWLILGALFLAAGLAMGPAVRRAGKARTATAYAV